MGLQANNFQVSGYKWVIPPYMKWNPSFHNDYFLASLRSNYSAVQNFAFWKGGLQADNFAVSGYKWVIFPYPNGANFYDAILGNVKSRKSYQVFF